MRRPFLLIVIFATGLFVLMCGYEAFIAPYSNGRLVGNGAIYDARSRPVGWIRARHDARLRSGPRTRMEYGWA